jgi:ribosome maturation factor RimP
VQVTLFAPQDGRRKFKGRILGVREEQVVIDQDGTEVTLKHGNIAKARLVPDYDSIFAARS